jgi:hypothetical protein
MKHLHEKGEISDTEYKAWKKKQKKVTDDVLKHLAQHKFRICP